MKRLLIKLAQWILKRYNVEQPTVSFTGYPQEILPYMEAAKQLCKEADERWPDRSGESKRHAVYARLIKIFPAAKRRDLGWAIEWALR